MTTLYIVTISPENEDPYSAVYKSEDQLLEDFLDWHEDDAEEVKKYISTRDQSFQILGNLYTIMEYDI